MSLSRIDMEPVARSDALGAPLVPPDDAARVRALRRHRLLGAPPDEVLDALTSMLAAGWEKPYAAVSLVDGRRQWFRSKVGIPIDGTARAHAFCARTVAAGDLFVVEDARRYPEFDSSPLVAPPIGVRFYAGYPIVDEEGYALGALSLMDRTPGSLDDRCGAALAELAGRAARRMIETARRLAREEALGPAAELHRVLLERSGDAVLIHGREGRLLAASERASELVGKPAAALRGADVLSLFPLDEVRAVLHHYDAVWASGEATLSTRIRRPGGTLLDVEVDSRLVGGACVQDIVHNLTERRDLERERRLCDVGQLAAGVAHDFNNVMTVVQGTLELAKVEVSEGAGGAELLEHLEVAYSAAENGRDVARQLLAFGRRQEMEPRAVELGPLVRGFVRLLRPSVGSAAVLRVYVAPGTGSVWMDETQLRRVLMNLVVNARDALAGPGVVTIEVTPVELPGEPAPCGRMGEDRDFQLVSVSDSGKGIPPELLDRIFDPFFTTKGERGTGLGLSTVHGIVRQSGGCVWVQSEPGVGTSVNVLLPSVGDAAPGASSPEVAGRGAVAPTVRAGGGSVLLVAGNAALRRALLGRLSNWRFHVLEADGIETARSTAGGAERDVDVVIACSRILDAPEAWEALHSLTPRAGVVRLLPPGVPFEADDPAPAVDEPYGPVTLLSAIERAGRICRLPGS